MHSGRCVPVSPTLSPRYPGSSSLFPRQFLPVSPGVSPRETAPLCQFLFCTTSVLLCTLLENTSALMPFCSFLIYQSRMTPLLVDYTIIIILFVYDSFTRSEIRTKFLLICHPRFMHVYAVFCKMHKTIIMRKPLTCIDMLTHQMENNKISRTCVRLIESKEFTIVSSYSKLRRQILAKLS